jgi:hypothetical protein
VVGMWSAIGGAEMSGGVGPGGVGRGRCFEPDVDALRGRTPMRPAYRCGNRGSSARWGARVAAGLAAGVLLAGCGGGTSPMSGSDRAATAGVCVNTAGEVATAVGVGVKLGAQSITLTQAQNQLKPIQDKVSAVAQQNVALPIGSKLQSLADAFTKVEQVNPGTTSELPADASDIGTAAKGVVDACAQVAR